MSPLLADRTGPALAAAGPLRTGRVTRLVGARVEVEGLSAAVGDAIRIHRDPDPLEAEVVAVSGGSLACLPLGELAGVRFGTPAEALGRTSGIRVGDGLLGRVVDGLGVLMDGKPPPPDLVEVPVYQNAPDPLSRPLVDQPLPLGIRAIDTLVTCGRGQRLGIFAGSGVGKSTLLSMITRGTSASVVVLALVGERGREVNEFLRNDLGEEGLARAVVVIATSDQPALVRVRAAFTATRIAEYFRDQGRDVLLLMDSLTRVAIAQREVGLAAGEPPATRGFPPSSFAILPRLLERAGPAPVGSITGLYTVLVEGDDLTEPVTDTARSILDGHLVLTRALATAGHYPAIDVLESVSRVAPAVTTEAQRAAATELRRLLAAYREARDLIEVGAYAAGTNPLVDRAVALLPFTEAFLRQERSEHILIDDAWLTLTSLVGAA